MQIRLQLNLTFGRKHDNRDEDTSIFFTELARAEADRAQQRHAYSTAANYKTALRSLTTFACRDNLLMKEIDGNLMEAWQAWLMRKGVGLNTVSCYMRSIRAIYRKAAEQGLPTTGADPFKKVFTGNTRTEKRAISTDDLRHIAALHLPKCSRMAMARDLFLFSYYCLGMPFVDMAFLRKSQIDGTHITYNRRKTGQPVRVPIEPCMSEIIDRYRRDDSPYVFPIITADDPKSAHEQYLKHLCRYNHALKRIAAKAGIDSNITSYVARHSWASAAYAGNVDLQVISKAMGHTNPNTTLIYIKDIDDQRLANANRTLIDKINRKE